MDPADISMLFGSLLISIPCFVKPERMLPLLASFWGADGDAETMGISQRPGVNGER